MSLVLEWVGEERAEGVAETRDAVRSCSKKMAPQARAHFRVFLQAHLRLSDWGGEPFESDLVTPPFHAGGARVHCSSNTPVLLYYSCVKCSPFLCFGLSSNLF